LYHSRLLLRISLARGQLVLGRFLLPIWNDSILWIAAHTYERPGGPAGDFRGVWPRPHESAATEV